MHRDLDSASFGASCTVDLESAWSGARNSRSANTGYFEVLTVKSRFVLARPTAAAGAILLAAALLTGCSAGTGIGVPIAPGVSLGVGVGSGGNVNVGVGTGVGPVGVGVGVNQRGQVSGGAGVGASVPVGGGARVGAGVGTSTVLHDPYQP